MAQAPEPGLYTNYEPLQVMTVIRRVLHETGPAFITGNSAFLPAVGQPVVPPNPTAEESFQLLTWSHHLHDVECAIPFIFDRLDRPTRVLIQGIFTQDFVPLVEFRTRLAVCFLLGLTAYAEMQLSPLGFSLGLQINAANRLVVDALVTDPGRQLNPVDANIATIEGGILNYDQIPSLAWPM